MKVKDVMSADGIKYCTPETRLVQAAKVMKNANRGALPVVDKDHKVVGIVTDRDICLSLAVKKGKAPSEISVKDILSTKKVHTIKPEDDVNLALREMRKNKIGRLPVTDETGKLKGMVSVNNLLSHALNKPEELGHTNGKSETLAKTIKTLFERNNTNGSKAILNELESTEW